MWSNFSHFLEEKNIMPYLDFSDFRCPSKIRQLSKYIHNHRIVAIFYNFSISWSSIFIHKRIIFTRELLLLLLLLRTTTLHLYWTKKSVTISDVNLESSFSLKIFRPKNMNTFLRGSRLSFPFLASLQ